jgi:intraflagellar transport protein 46
MPKQRVDDDDD